MANGMNSIAKGKNLEESLPRYAGYMMDLYHRQAFLKFTINYYTYYEVLSEYAGQNRENILHILEELNDVVKQALPHSLTGKEREEAIEKISGVRSEITGIVSVLTTYVDIFTRYEYVVNRIEQRFEKDLKKPDISDEEMTKKVLRYMIADKDNAVVNARISEMIGELPVRMVKNKFYEYVNEGVNVYSEAGKQSFDDYIFMLRSTALLDRPEGFESMFPELYDILVQFETLSFSSITEEQFRSMSTRLAYVAETAGKLTDIYAMAAELVNDVYVILLAAPYVKEAAEITLCREICTRIAALFNQSEYTAVDEETESLLVGLEGKPEEVGDECDRAEYVIDIVKNNYMDIATGIMCGPVYEALFLCEKLMSGSLFAEMSEEMGDDALSSGYFEQVKEKLIKDMGASFAGRDKMFNRAVMGAVLSALPVFFQNMNEVKDYVAASLDNCRDEAEKSGCIRLINRIIEEY